MCSSDSLYFGVSAHSRSVSVCPVNKFGPRCLLIDAVCQTGENSSCLNGGQCIPNDDYMTNNPRFVCICPEGFAEDRCETIDNKLS